MRKVSYALGVQEQDLLFFLSLLVACQMTMSFFLKKPSLYLKKHFKLGFEELWLVMVDQIAPMIESPRNSSSFSSLK